MADRRVEAVIFDLDGVLTDTAEYHYLAWQAIADEAGLTFDRRANEALRGLSREASLRAILGDIELDAARFAELLERKNRRYLQLLASMGPDDLLEGAADLVAEVRRRGRLTAVGSSSRNARMVLERLGITDQFDAIADGDSAAAAKPDPGIFLAAAADLGVAPPRCVVVEDAASGVEAAHAGGMRAVGIGPADRVGDAELRFERTADVDVDALLGCSGTPGRC